MKKMLKRGLSLLLSVMIAVATVVVGGNMTASAGYTLRYPVAGYSSVYISGSHYSSSHTGTDFGGNTNCDVLAAADGVVAQTYTYTGNTYGQGYVDTSQTSGGTRVAIYHESLGIYTLYFHMDALYVSQGQSVRAGDAIGSMGNTGYSAGVHLHFEICTGIHNYAYSNGGSTLNPEECNYTFETLEPPTVVNIPDGVYVFHCVRNTDRVLDIQYDSKEKGANIQLFDNLYNQVQKFRVVNKDGYCCIQSVYSGMWLDISSPYNQQGSNIQLWDTNTSKEQKWKFEDAGNGNVYIHSLYGMYLDTGGPTDNRTNIQTWAFDRSTSQQWKLEKTSPYPRVEVEEGVYTIHSVRNSNKVLDIEGDSKENKANIQLYEDLNNEVQQFKIIKKTNSSTGNIYYNIQSVYSGHWLDIASPFSTPGCNIQLYNSNAEVEEKWVFEDRGNGKVLIRSLYGTYVDIGNGSATNGSNIKSNAYYDLTSMEWTLHKVYTVSFNANGGSGAPETQYKQQNINLKLSSLTPTKSGSRFTGWNTQSNGSGTSYSAGGTYSGNANVTLYAQWASNQLTVAFNPNGGTCSTASKTVTYNSTYGTLPTPTRSGYDFDGWYTASSGGTKITSSSAVTITSNQTLYAHWTAKQFTVTFNPNGGTCSTASKTVTFNSTYGTLPTPTRTGYNFDNWYTTSSGGTKITASSVVTITSNQTLYALWTAKQFTVTFNPNGGACSTSSKTVTYNSTYGTLPTPTRTGYKFDGWYTASSGGTMITASSTVTITSGQTLYAHWTQNAVLTSIAVKTLPSKTVYEVGETFSDSGLTLTATYSNGATQTVLSGFSCTGFSSDKAGSKTITVTYGGQTTTFTVTVNGSTVEIRNYQAERTVHYKTSVRFTAVPVYAPANATAHWFVNGAEVDVGETCTVRQPKSDYTVQVKLFDDGGQIIAESEVETVHVKRGIWSRIRAFLLMLWGADGTIEQSVPYDERIA